VLLNRIHRDGRVTGAPADAAKGLDVVGVGFGSDKLTVRGATPKISAAGMEEAASERTESPDELARIAALKSGPRKLQKQLLKSLVRLRRVARTPISGVGCQCAPIF
jgi:hypothetical protein